MAKYFRILSIDGGGIRGILPGQILVSLEKELQKQSGSKSARIADYFDLIAGTSTGGMLTCIYLCPDKNNPARPQFSAQDAVDLYLERGDEIFDVSFWHKIKSGDGLLDEKYSADHLEEALKDYFGEMKMDELLRSCMITAYDTRRRRTHFFTKHDAVKTEKDNFLVRDVCRATSAAPTYFEAARIKSDTKIPYPLIDGGVFANNPALCAYAEARKLSIKNCPKKPTAKDMVILSLGTGKIKKPYYYKEIKDWGLVQWIKPLIDILMSAGPETVDYQLKLIFDAVDAKSQYLRIMPELGTASPEMDDASADNLRALAETGAEAAEKNEKNIKKIVKLLLQE
ncbi:patatin-like phospholipase family protein [candidate division KSB1 bacterium]